MIKIKDNKMSNKQPTIYELMSKKRLEIAAAQIDILSHYVPEKKEVFVQRLYDAYHKSIIDEQSEKSLEEMNKLIEDYLSEIERHRKNNPELEKSSEIKKKLNELEDILTRFNHP